LGIIRRGLRRLAVPLLAATATVGTGIAINAAFVTGRGLIWPWVLAAIALAALGARLSSPAKESGQAGGLQPAPSPDRATAAAEADRRDAMVAHLHELAADHVPARLMPITWAAEKSDYDPDAAGDIRISGSAALSRYFLNTSSRRLVVIGKPGSGKTVLAWRLALDIADQQDVDGPVPVVLPIGNWDPFDESFESWLRRQLAEVGDESGLNVNISGVLPVLDGFDEYSSQLRSRALAILSGRELSAQPLILVSRCDEYKFSELWRNFLTDAAIVQLEPPSTVEVIHYLEGLPRSERGSPLDLIAGELRDHPDGTAAEVLSSPFMLDIAGNEYLHRYPQDFLEVASGRDVGRAEEFLARCFVRRRVESGYRWEGNNVRKWLAAVARRSGEPFAFRPNELETPGIIGVCLMIIAAVLPAAALALYMRNLHIALIIALAVAYGFGLMVFGTYTSHGPTLDPRRELRLERAVAAEKATITLAATASLGFLNLMAPHVGTWILGFGAALGALLGILKVWGVRERLAGGAAGALCGLTVGWAAYAGIHSMNSWGSVFFGLIVGGIAFVIVLIVNFAGHVTGGQGREGITVAPLLAAALGLPVALWAGSVFAISNSNPAWFHVEIIDKFAGILLYTITLAAALVLTTHWTSILVQRVYYALTGVFPLRLLDFLEDFSQAGVLRRVGYSYEFRHPAVLCTIKRGDALDG
jgi:GTPase SAR1 family protein